MLLRVLKTILRLKEIYLINTIESYLFDVKKLIDFFGEK